ncbi:MAG: hypothetical protein L6N94_06040 [Candidatus Methylarchaceae archaeon HK01M]|nr:hypothetical protein [Candidatus Methylarchaceae archaeon HK01M]
MISKIVVYSVIFGVLAVILTMVFLPLPIGNPNLGSTPVVIAAVLYPWPVGIIVGIIKGIGASLWTGKWYVELPGGVGDALMAVFAYKLSKRMKIRNAVIGGQLSRYIFTSGAVALLIASMISLGVATPDITNLYLDLSRRLHESAPIFSFLTENPGFLSIFSLVWIGISFPAITLSIALNTIVALSIVIIIEKKSNL